MAADGVQVPAGVRDLTRFPLFLRQRRWQPREKSSRILPTTREEEAEENNGKWRRTPGVPCNEEDVAEWKFHLRGRANGFG